MKPHLHRSGIDLRITWTSSYLVPVLSPWSFAVRPLWHAQIINSSSSSIQLVCGLRSTTVLSTGPNHVYNVHCWSYCADSATRFLSSSLRRWYADLQLTSTADHSWSADAVTKARRKTRCPKLTNWYQPLLGRSSPYCENVSQEILLFKRFSDCRYMP